MDGMSNSMQTIPSVDVLDRPSPGEPGSDRRSFVPARAVGKVVRPAWHGLASAGEWLFGAVALVIGLAILAAIPIVQFLSLGYLLEAAGRVARTGRLRDGLIGFRRSARVGGLVAGCWLTLLPLRLVASLARSAELIDPGGDVGRRWRTALLVLTVLLGTHLIAACARGGRLRNFLWPFGNPPWLIRRLWRGGFFAECRDAIWDFVASLRLPYYFRLGFLGFLGTLAWLVVPVTLIAAGRTVPLLGFLGALALGIVAPALPFLQARYAAEGRFRALFERRAVRDRFRRAPWAFAAALFATLAAAVPLYLLKIEMVPREAAWLPSLLFVIFLYPARLLAGWAYARSGRRDLPRHWVFRGSGRLWMVPTAGFYVLIVFLAQYTSWGGLGSLYEQHAFLLPVPFLDM